MVTVLPPSEIEELFAHVLEDDPAHVGAREGRVEQIRVLVERHHQGLLLGLRGGRRQQGQGGEPEHEPRTETRPPHACSPF
jgi:hypothetical protein